jgi:hypothetical protein
VGPAVDEVQGPGDEAGFVGGEERHEVGDLLGLGVAAEDRVLLVLLDDARDGERPRVSWVRTRPGPTALTRMPAGPSSMAATSTSMATPALETQ